MGLEGPISVSAISRLPNATVNTAAFQVLMAIALLIESPVIDLLSTSTTLAKSRQAFHLLRRFTIGLGVALTFVHIALVFTPLFSLFASNVLRIPDEVARAAQLGLQWMVPWSAAIGWRRFNQGLLIRNGQTRWVGIGTGLRVTTMTCSVTSLVAWGKLSGIETVGIGLIASVVVEACFSHWAARRVIHRIESQKSDSSGEISYSQLCRFHFPLSATTLIMLGSQPLISYALARSPDAVESLAGYQVALTLGWLLRAAVYALPEAIITLGSNPGAVRELRRFTLTTGSLMSGILFALALSGIDQTIFITLLGAEPPVAAAAHIAFLCTGALPLIGALQAYCRGLLTIHHNTGARLLAMIGGTTVLVACLLIGIQVRVPGVMNATLSMAIAHTFELGLLYALLKRSNAPQLEATG